MITIVLLMTKISLAQTIPAETISRLKNLYPDQDNALIQNRLDNAKELFDKWRTFPPYFYDMALRNKYQFERKGTCAGDSHLENFGFLPLDQGPTFSLIDFDDVSTCSLDLDLMRLYIAHKFIADELSPEDFKKNYSIGLSGQECKEPETIRKLKEESSEDGKKLPNKYVELIKNGQKKCEGDFKTLSSQEENDLKESLSVILGEPKKAPDCESCSHKKENISTSVSEMAKIQEGIKGNKFYHGCSRIKAGGGSGGQKRYVVFYQTVPGQGKIEALELKPLNKAAPEFASKKKISQKKRVAKYNQAVDTFLGKELKKDYFAFEMNKKIYQRLPLWKGAKEIKLKDFKDFSSEKKLETLYYETCQLGALHRKSNSSPKFNFDTKIAHQFMEQFKKEFGQ
jgi:hypothetical protein